MNSTEGPEISLAELGLIRLTSKSANEIAANGQQDRVVPAKMSADEGTVATALAQVRFMVDVTGTRAVAIDQGKVSC